jgi:phosphoribosylanthranilate isomerase
MPIQVKICGLNDTDSVAAAVQGGADYVGFNFYPPSPRSVSPQQAGALAARVPEAVRSVAVLVDPDDELVRAVMAHLRPRILQLHGREGPGRVAQLREEHGVQVMKAIPVAGPEDVAAARAFERVADLLMFDGKAPAALPGALPGGNGRAFDWRILAGHASRLPWILAGGLDAGNVAEAVATAGAPAVDVSSGVEDKPGLKNPAKIRAFLAAVRGL